MYTFLRYPMLYSEPENLKVVALHLRKLLLHLKHYFYMCAPHFYHIYFKLWSYSYCRTGIWLHILNKSIVDCISEYTI